MLSILAGMLTLGVGGLLFSLPKRIVLVEVLCTSLFALVCSWIGREVLGSAWPEVRSWVAGPGYLWASTLFFGAVSVHDFRRLLGACRR